MKIGILGGGPGGLYLAILLKKASPDHDVTVVERNAPGATFGWGVVFSDETLGYLEENDYDTYLEIGGTFATWDAIEVRYKGQAVRSGGHGFSGIARRRLLQILQRRSRGLGVRLLFDSEVDDLARFADCDLVVAADGVNSKTRQRFESQFKPTLNVRRNRFAWFGTTLPFERFTFSFRETEHGLFWCHAYRFDDQTSTFIVECSDETWRRANLDTASEPESLRYCEAVFADDLQGHPLLSNRSLWINFTIVKNERWYHDNVVLLGDAAHTAHFSIGSGTKLAMEDAIALARALERCPNLPTALAEYEEERQYFVERFQRAALESLSWFEHVERYRHFDPLRFTFALLSRSRRVSYENLTLRDPAFMQQVAEDWWARQPHPLPPTTPPMFAPFQLREMRLDNRVVVSPMCMYSAEDGTVDDWHLVHLGSRAIGGAGLVIAEMTDVSREGRITPGCAGIYKPEHVVAWRRIVDFVHARTSAKIALQLGHAGRKGSTKLMWEGIDEPLEDGNWPLVSASPIPYLSYGQVPKAMDRTDMDRVRDDFVRAALMAEEAGFDMLEVHFAHGYLLSSFISPLTNVRTDQYGGPLDNRLRFPMEVFDAVRAAWPIQKPMSVRISATDWAVRGLTPEDSVEMARILKAHGCDVVDVSAGQTTIEAQPVYGRMFQTPFSDQIRNEANVATMTVGAITHYDEVNSILVAGRADLCVLARPHLRDPYWTLHAAQMQDYYELRWPSQYEPVQPAPREPRKFILDPKQEAEARLLETRRLRRRVWELERELDALRARTNGAAPGAPATEPGLPTIGRSTS